MNDAPSHSQYGHIDLGVSTSFAIFYIAGIILTFIYYYRRGRKRGLVSLQDMLVYACYALVWPLAFLIEAIFFLF